LDEARARAHRQVVQAVAALDTAGLEAPILAALAHYVVERDK
jgi:hypothetical protein